ncbi:MAG: hypothetical protein K2N39_02795 [Lachnospiraceae bacterium]|nr:hypothetical protein [Lachnospiraceae bacterium]
MRQEKRPENVSERSPLNKTNIYMQEIENGAGLGKDCAVFCTRPHIEACRDAADGLRGGQEKKVPLPDSQMAGAEQDIVVSKWIGLEGTARLAGANYERLRQRLPARMIEEAATFDRYLSVIPEAATAMKSGVCGIHAVSRGGIFAGLW